MIKSKVGSRNKWTVVDIPQPEKVHHLPKPSHRENVKKPKEDSVIDLTLDEDEEPSCIPSKSPVRHTKPTNVDKLRMLLQTNKLSHEQIEQLSMLLKRDRRQKVKREDVLHYVDKHPIRISELSKVQSTASWLTDEVINAYTTLLSWQSDKLRIVSTHFWTALTGNGSHYNYDKVKLWGKEQIPLKSYRHLLIPVNVNGNHWALLAVQLSKKRVRYFDSMRFNRDKAMSMMEMAKQYIEDECRLKQIKLPRPDKKWRLRAVDTAKQKDGSSCGVFCLHFARKYIDRYVLAAIPKHENLFSEPVSSEMVRAKILYDLSIGVSMLQ